MDFRQENDGSFPDDLSDEEAAAAAVKDEAAKARLFAETQTFTRLHVDLSWLHGFAVGNKEERLVRRVEQIHRAIIELEELRG